MQTALLTIGLIKCIMCCRAVRGGYFSFYEYHSLKKESMSTTISDDTRAPKAPFKIKSHHLLWVITISMVLTLAGVIVIMLKDSDAEKSAKIVVEAIKDQTDAVTDDSNATRTVINKVGVAVEKASEVNVKALSKVADILNVKLDAKTVEITNALTALQVATTTGLTGVEKQVEKSGEASKTSTDKLDVTLTETKAELAALKAATPAPVTAAVDPNRPAEQPVVATPVTQTDSLSLAKTASKAPVAKSRGLKQSAPIETSEWKNVPAGTVSDTYSCDAVRQRKIEIQEDIDGLIVLSYRGWPKRLIGQYPVGDTVPIAHGATSVAFMHPTKSFNIKVNK